MKQKDVLNALKGYIPRRKDFSDIVSAWHKLRAGDPDIWAVVKVMIVIMIIAVAIPVYSMNGTIKAQKSYNNYLVDTVADLNQTIDNVTAENSNLSLENSNLTEQLRLANKRANNLQDQLDLCRLSQRDEGSDRGSSSDFVERLSSASPVSRKSSSGSGIGLDLKGAQEQITSAASGVTKQAESVLGQAAKGLDTAKKTVLGS